MNFSAALLAGGRSSRMGRDKAFLDWHGQPLWRVQMEKLAVLQPAQLFVAAREDQNFAAELSRVEFSTPVDLVNDPVGEDCGPIAPIARCLRRTTLPLLVLAVDMPLMTVAFLRDRLLQAVAEGKGVVCRGVHGFQPLAAVYASAALPFAEAALAERRFALQPLLAALAAAGLCSVVELEGDEEDRFANTNTPAEAARLLGFPNESARA